MNVKLLREVKEAILKKPTLFDMRDWFMQVCNAKDGTCGTAGCIAGWAITLDAGHKKPLEQHEDLWGQDRGQELLELSHEEANRLFYVDHWPEPFAQDYRGGEARKDRVCRAKTAAARIEHFIKTEGRE